MKITASLTEHELKQAVALLMRDRQKLKPHIRIEVVLTPNVGATASWDPDEVEPRDPR